MPIYEYRCENGHTFEVLQKMTDDPVSVCPTCGAPVQRVFHPVAVHFKGKGFYNTDYGTKRRNRELERSGKSGSDSSDSSSSSSSSSDRSGSGDAKGKSSDSGSGSSKAKDSGSSSGSSATKKD
jgi:putative FmdB family regulatory protein